MHNKHLTFQRKYRIGVPVLLVLIGCGTLCMSKTKAPVAWKYEGMDLILRMYFKPLPNKMPGSEKDSKELIALGRKLYFERGISLNKSQACNDCHHLDKPLAGVDRNPTSKGAIGVSGKRNSPTVLNAGFQAVQFWDGRSPDLVEQAKGPLLNPIEMGMRTKTEVVERLNSREDIRRGFKLAFPTLAEAVTFDNVAIAIAAFERTLITPSRFDRYLKGDRKALSNVEVQGLHTFVHTGCIQCHNSYTVGGRTMQKLGVYNPYRNRKDLRRYEVTHQADDKYVFKVPMLRNVTMTAPYFHDGKAAKLQEAIRLMAWMQLNKKLDPSEIKKIENFLHTLEAEHTLIVEES